ncbi:MAG: DUF86 domain-containing protein [Chloroflexi bacterium]|nr:DUF86 domain-containing protein [Chloroflexota bacterium]
MNGKQEYLDYIRDMLDGAEKALAFVVGMEYEEFVQDVKTQFAVVRALEIVGEAAKKIPRDVKESYTEIPWREISGTRDKLIHDYIGVNLAVVWRTLQEDLPPLVERLRSLLQDLGKL